MKSIRIGSGAGYSGDRLEPALDLIEKGNLDYIIFECLAERTIAIAQQEKMKNPKRGYDSLLEYRMRKILPLMAKKSVKVISNMGAANPISAVEAIVDIAKELKVSNIKIAAVFGDEITEIIDNYSDYEVLETGKLLSELEGDIISANVYMGADGIVEALKNGANIIITGRVSDPALTLGPLMYEFDWKADDFDKIGKGISLGHLLECAGQVTGGYFADPGKKDVKNLANLGFPYADITQDGVFTITKLENSGGEVSLRTCKEQIIYEIHDPAKYLTPDATADFSNISMKEIKKDLVEITGATSYGKSETLKVSIGYKDCYTGEGEITYGGESSYGRAKLAGEIVVERLKIANVEIEELKVDLIGVNSLFMDKISKNINGNCIHNEVCLRICGRTKTKSEAIKIGNEVETLYTNGPFGGGGATKVAKEIISVCSIFIPRKDVKALVEYKEI